MLEPISGEARNSLKQFVEHCDDLYNFVKNKWRPNGEPKKILEHLKKYDLITYKTYINESYYVSLTYDGENYFQDEEQYVAQKEKGSAVNTFIKGDRNIVQTGNGNFAQIITRKNNEIVISIQKLINELDECIPQEKKEEIIENAEFLQEELVKEKPRKNLINKCFETLNEIAVSYPEAISFIANLTTIAGFIIMIAK